MRLAGYCWSPGCMKWVPEHLMNYDADEHIRVCTPCLEGTSAVTNYIMEEHHEDTKCIYCGSYDTVENAPHWRHFRCQNCGKEFYLL